MSGQRPSGAGRGPKPPSRGSSAKPKRGAPKAKSARAASPKPGRPTSRSAPPRRAGAAKAAGPATSSGSAKGPGSAKATGSAKWPAKRSGPGRGRTVPTGGPRPGQKPDRGLGGTQVEGRHSVRELLLAGNRRVTEVLIAADMDHAAILDDIVELARDMKVPVREVSKHRLDTQSSTESSQGVMAYAAELPDHDLDDLATVTASGPAPFLLAVDGVTDPGNLGALIRTAECAGVTGVLLPKHRAVHISPTVTKAAAGAIEHVPMALVGGLPTAIEHLKALGVWVIGLDAGGEQSLHEMTLGAEPVCLVLGAEGSGLSRLVRERCDVTVTIPLRGVLSSLNVATAGALACYEIVRRRPVP